MNEIRQSILDFDIETALSNFRTTNSELTRVKVTKNGEVSYDLEDREFVVYDETYAYEVGRTPYPMLAWCMLTAYCEHYLGKDE